VLPEYDKKLEDLFLTPEIKYDLHKMSMFEKNQSLNPKMN